MPLAWGAVIFFLLACVYMATKGEDQLTAEDRAYWEDRHERLSRPWVVISVMGETALLERYDGARYNAINSFPDLSAGMLVEVNEKMGIIDYLLP